MLISTPNFEKCEMFAHKIDDYIFCFLPKNDLQHQKEEARCLTPEQLRLPAPEKNVSESEYY